MDKLLEIGEIGPLHDIPSELTFLIKENKVLRLSTDKLKFQKRVLVISIILLVCVIIWVEIKPRKEKKD